MAAANARRFSISSRALVLDFCLHPNVVMARDGGHRGGAGQLSGVREVLGVLNRRGCFNWVVRRRWWYSLTGPIQNFAGGGAISLQTPLPERCDPSG